MSIPPHRVAGEVGHIDDHNAIVDALTGNDQDIATVTTDLESHISGLDPHGDRAYTDQQIASALSGLVDPPVDSVNGQTGDVVLSAGDVGAETPAGAQNKVDDLETTLNAAIDTKVDSSTIGQPNGVAPLDVDGLVDESYIPTLTGSNRLTVSETTPDVPSDGDVWINTGQASPGPLPGMPDTYKSIYEGPNKMTHSDLPSAGTWGSFPIDHVAPIVFTTGPTGYTEIHTNWTGKNNATDTSTLAIGYALNGDGVDYPAGLQQGAYQGSTGFNYSVPVRLFGVDTFNLPPGTEVTLSPSLRLSSLPSSTDQNNGNLGVTDRIFRLDASQPSFFLVKTW